MAQLAAPISAAQRAYENSLVRQAIVSECHELGDRAMLVVDKACFYDYVSFLWREIPGQVAANFGSGGVPVSRVPLYSNAVLHIQCDDQMFQQNAGTGATWLAMDDMISLYTAKFPNLRSISRLQNPLNRRSECGFLDTGAIRSMESYRDWTANQESWAVRLRPHGKDIEVGWHFEIFGTYPPIPNLDKPHSPDLAAEDTYRTTAVISFLAEVWQMRAGSSVWRHWLIDQLSQKTWSTGLRLSAITLSPSDLTTIADARSASCPLVELEIQHPVKYSAKAFTAYMDAVTKLGVTKLSLALRIPPHHVQSMCAIITKRATGVHRLKLSLVVDRTNGGARETEFPLYWHANTGVVDAFTLEIPIQALDRFLDPGQRSKAVLQLLWAMSSAIRPGVTKGSAKLFTRGDSQDEIFRRHEASIVCKSHQSVVDFLGTASMRLTSRACASLETLFEGQSLEGQAVHTLHLLGSPGQRASLRRAIDDIIAPLMEAVDSYLCCLDSKRGSY